MSGQNTHQLEAVILFRNEKVDRELQYPEFEAVMDGYVPIPDYAATRSKAVYIRVNSQLLITTAVFFLVDFDEKGMLAKSWNVPFQQLAEKAGKGPNLGADAIRLACFSQCPIPWQQDNLWDPQMEPGRNSFVLMRKAVAANRLGLLFPETEKVEHKVEVNTSIEKKEALEASLRRRFSQELRDRLAQTIKEQRLRINTINSRYELKINKLKLESQSKLFKYTSQIESNKKEMIRLEKDHQLLERELILQRNKVDGLHEYFERKLTSSDFNEKEQVQALEENFDEKLQNSTRELTEKLDEREMALFYSQQQCDGLQSEISLLKDENKDLLTSGGYQLLVRLEKSGISFVTAQPGVDNLTISATEISDYLDDKPAYIASKCGVDEKLYALWIDHYHAPCCTALDQDREECGVGVKRIVNLEDFQDGESNRCNEHRTLGDSVAVR